MRNICLEIKKYLVERGVTEAELSRLSGINQQNLNRMLKGSDIRLSHLEKICQALNIPVSYFFDENIKVLPERPPKPIKNESERLVDLEREVRLLAKKVDQILKQKQ